MVLERKSSITRIINEINEPFPPRPHDTSEPQFRIPSQFILTSHRHAPAVGLPAFHAIRNLLPLFLSFQRQGYSKLRDSSALIFSCLRLSIINPPPDILPHTDFAHVSWSPLISHVVPTTEGLLLSCPFLSSLFCLKTNSFSSLPHDVIVIQIPGLLRL